MAERTHRVVQVALASIALLLVLAAGSSVLAAGGVAATAHVYDAPALERADTHEALPAEGGFSEALVGGGAAQTRAVATRRAATTPLSFTSTPSGTTGAASGARGTTAHGTSGVAGAGATRGGVLNPAEIAVVRGSGTVYQQSNGAVARVLQQADGRYSVVVDGNRGLITTFKNLSQSSLDRLSKNYGWTLQ